MKSCGHPGGKQRGYSVRAALKKSISKAQPVCCRWGAAPTWWCRSYKAHRQWRVNWVKIRLATCWLQPSRCIPKPAPRSSPRYFRAALWRQQDWEILSCFVRICICWIRCLPKRRADYARCSTISMCCWASSPSVVCAAGRCGALRRTRPTLKASSNISVWKV